MSLATVSSSVDSVTEITCPDERITIETEESLIERLISDDGLLLILDYLLPENLYFATRVNKRWNAVCSTDTIWKKFCCPYWDIRSSSVPQMTAASPSRIPVKSKSFLDIPSEVAQYSTRNTPNSWKQAYLMWLQRMAKRLRDIHDLNTKLLAKYSSDTSAFYPVTFFWPSYAALRERYAFKILIAGDIDTGKSSLLLRFTENRYTNNAANILNAQTNNNLNNIGVNTMADFKLRTIQLYEQIIELQMVEIDINDSSEMVSHKNSYIAQAHGCLICFDVNNSESYNSAKKALDKIVKHNTNVIPVLVGTKIDSRPPEPTTRASGPSPTLRRSHTDPTGGTQKVISTETAKRFADSRGIMYFETSSVDSVNVEDCFFGCAKLVFKQVAWPNYIPPEKIFRHVVGVPEVDWWISNTPNITKSGSLNLPTLSSTGKQKKGGSCRVQ